MTVRAVLWTYKPRKDGSCNIKFYIHNNDGKKYQATKYYAHPKDWDENSGRFKRSAANWKQLNALIEREQNKIIGEIVGADSSLLRFIESYIEECRNGVHDLKHNTYRQYITHLDKLKAFGKELGKYDLQFGDIDPTWHAQFLAWLKKNGLGSPGRGKQIKHLRKFLRLGYERQIHDNKIFDHKLFIPERHKPSPKIYFQEKEIEAIESLSALDATLNREKDRFLVSYYLLLRHGDSVRVTGNNFFDRDGKTFFRNQAEKTGAISIVPVNSKAKRILSARNWELGYTSNQDANRKIKMLAALANISSLFEGKPKWTHATTHTARRSAATNLFLQGVPLAEVAQLGGWSSEKVLRTYLLAGGIELATVSADRDFFQ